MATRARKHYDKWLDLSRSQAREWGKKVGLGEAKANTELKLQAFAEALQKFEAHLVKTGSAPVAMKKVAPKTKKTRNASHRAARATVREELSVVKETLEGARPQSCQKESRQESGSKNESRQEGGCRRSCRIRRVRSQEESSQTGSPHYSTGGRISGWHSTRARIARHLRLQSSPRLDRSGATSRVRGHVSARGKRAQGRRDAKG